MSRTLSPYEFNHLVSHGFDPEAIDQHGEKPVEYITGHVTFCGHDFMVTPDVLIPRVETEELVELAFQKVTSMLATGQSAVEIADVGTGSGAIAISLWLKLLPLLETDQRVSFTMSDISESALEVARQNIKRLVPAAHRSRLNVITSNLFADYPQEKQFDLVISNLPYIPTGRIASLDASVKDFEPAIALDGGEQGLSLIQAMLVEVQSRLKPSGLVLLEIDYTHTPQELVTEAPALQASVITDQFLRQRFAIITKK